MIRTQVQLTEDQLAALRSLSAARDRSIADLVRMGVDLLVSQETAHGSADRFERARRLAGRFASGSADGSAKHDNHLAAEYGRE